MKDLTRGMRPATILVIAALAGGCTLIPPEGPSILAQRPKIDSGPSAQRLGPDGYPLLGAFPNSAAAQLPDAAVGARRGDLQSAAATQNASGTSAAAMYRQSIAEAEAVRAQTRRDVDAAVSTGQSVGAPAMTNEEVLRRIEGR